MKKISAIYTITNIMNGKIYIGYTENYNERIFNHKNELKLNRHKNTHLQLSYNKYGEENFVFEILEECLEEFLVSLEHYWCNILDTHNPERGYNIGATNPNSRSSRPMLGKIHSLETRLKISKNRKGKAKGKNNYFYGKTHSEETKRKMSIKKKGKVFFEETISKMSESKKGIVPKNLDSIKGWNKGRKMSPEYGKRISDIQKMKVYQYSSSGEFIKEHDSAKDASKFLGKKSHCEIGKSARGVTNALVFGFKWSYDKR